MHEDATKLSYSYCIEENVVKSFSPSSFLSARETNEGNVHGDTNCIQTRSCKLVKCRQINNSLFAFTLLFLNLVKFKVVF